jgi:hypothetical protein
MARLLLLQCELEHRHQAPHLAMCLFASDLRAAGHEVRAALVHPSAIQDVAAGSDVDLLLLDSIFPFRLVRELRSALGAPVLIGGHSALQHMLRGDADHALVGAARRLLPAAIEAILSPGPTLPPGLWTRLEDGTLDCGPGAPPTTPRDEVLPYTPDFEWEYFGPPRAPGSNLRVPSVVAELGCPYDTKVLGPADRGFYAGVEPRTPDVPMTARARDEIERSFVQRDGGCTFCVFRYQPFRRHTPREARALLVTQLEALRALGARGFSLQTENPLSYLDEVLPLAAGLGFEEVHVRTIPWLILRHREALVRAAETAGRLDIELVLGQVGFEAFDERGLEVFHKGLSPRANREAARLLTELTAAHPRFEGTRGHGFIALHPWTRIEDLRTNLDACREDAPWLLPDLDPRRRLEIYNEWSPLFWKAQDDGLIDPAEDRFGWSFRFADDRTSEVVAVASALTTEGRTPGHEVLDRVLTAREENPGPDARKAAYLRLRAELRV